MFHIKEEVLFRTSMQEKEIKDPGWKKMKITLFSNDMILPIFGKHRKS
jgi:hypothetical protein